MAVKSLGTNYINGDVMQQDSTDGSGSGAGPDFDDDENTRASGSGDGPGKYFYLIIFHCYILWDTIRQLILNIRPHFNC